MLFYISTSSISRGKIFRLMITGATTQPHHKSTARASWPWSIEFFPVRSRVVAGDWPVITGCVRWEWSRLAASNQSSTRCRASLYHCQESWKVEGMQDPRQERLWSDRPWPLPPTLASDRFHCNFEAMQSTHHQSRRCSLGRHSASWIDQLHEKIFSTQVSFVSSAMALLSNFSL